MTKSDSQELINLADKLRRARFPSEFVEAVRTAAGALLGTDGITLVVREGDCVRYVDESAIGPLWKGRSFHISNCVSGWAMLNKQMAIVADISTDDRIPYAAYEPTFVKSLVMVPLPSDDPKAAVGFYWATIRSPARHEIEIIKTLTELMGKFYRSPIGTCRIKTVDALLPLDLTG